jgi:hypothetical protein
MTAAASDIKDFEFAKCHIDVSPGESVRNLREPQQLSQTDWRS